MCRRTVSGNGALGINLFGHGTTVSQCTVVANTVSGNSGGGIYVVNATSVIIVGNVFFKNGSVDSVNAGAGVYIGNIMTNQAEISRLEFNSFNQNMTKDGLNIGSAIHCGTGVMLAARNNIMSGNGTATNHEQVGGPCTHTYSIVYGGSSPAGMGNIEKDPLFKDTTTGDLHLKSGSPAIRAADPNSNLTGIAAYDIDGDLRVTRADIGADQTR